MLPDFTEDGLLPPGIHRTTLAEFERRFVYFAVSDRRFRLFDKLRVLHEEARRSGIVCRFLVAGSFVSSKPEPNDFDCILLLNPSLKVRALGAQEYNLVIPARARRIFGGDVFPVREGTPKAEELLEFFQFSRQGERIGIVEIEL
jgi:hypothetical protein